MKKFIIALVLFFSFTGCSQEMQLFQNNSIIGTWASYSDNTKMIFQESGELIIVNADGSTIKSGAIEDYNGVIQNIKITYQIDFNQDPIWLDIVFDMGKEKNRTIAIVNFIDNNKIEIINSRDSEIRPTNVRKNSDIIEMYSKE